MRTEKNILIAFILNFLFSVFEFIGGIITGSVAIISDAVHDIGDAAGIGISYYFEKKSKKHPDNKYTYGYARYSVLGGFITILILILGSAAVVLNAIKRIINPVQINYNSMIIFAIIGVIVNLTAAYITHESDSINQKAVNLHMLEDVLGWIVVLIGAVVMRFTDFSILDPLMSLGLALFIMINSFKNLKEILYIFLKKVPEGISVEEIKNLLINAEGVVDVHHIHIWSLDGNTNCATMHIVTDADSRDIKENVKERLKKHGISHVTLELESTADECNEKICCIKTKNDGSQHHRHHH